MSTLLMQCEILVLNKPDVTSCPSQEEIIVEQNTTNHYIAYLKMTSGPPVDENPAPTKPTQTQTLISGGFALVYNFHQFKESWAACDTDRVCKMEKILLYITVVFGISKPLLFLSDTLENAVNKLWMKLQGAILIQKNSAWNTSMQFWAIFGMLDQYLTKGWNWIRYATNCLKQDSCENDDILVWITNMKIRYCGRRVDFDGDELLECETNGRNCKVLDEERKINTGATCIAFFNKVPLIFARIVIWTIYFQLNNIIDFFKKLSPWIGGGGGGQAGNGGGGGGPPGNGGGGGGPPGNGGGGGGPPKDDKKDDKKDDNGNKTKGDSSSDQDNTKPSGSQKGPEKPTKDPKPCPRPSNNVGGGTGDQNGNSDQENRRGSGDGPNATGNGKEDSTKNSKKTEICNECKGKGEAKTKSQDKTKQRPPSKTKEKECESPNGESKSANNPPPIQYFDVLCVLCRKLYRGCFPDPVPMCCGACNPKSPPNPSTSSKDPDTCCGPNPDPNNQPSTSSKPAVPPSAKTPGEMTLRKVGDPSSSQLPNQSRCVPNQESSDEEELSDLNSSDEELLDLLVSLEDEWELNSNHELNQCLQHQNQPHNHIDPSLDNNEKKD